MHRLLASLLVSVTLAAAARGDEPFPAHRVVGNVYYVGSKELASYLITSPDGHFLINSSFEETVPLIRGAVESLGFKMRDVKILLASHAHSDHVAGHAMLKELTGAATYVMTGDDRVIADGGAGQYLYADTRWPPCKVDRVLKDGEEVKLGGVTLTPRRTPGHTRGCTTWTWQVADGDKTLNVVVIGSPNVNAGYKLVDNADYPEIAKDYETTFAVLKALPCDVFLGAHGNYYDLLAKYERLQKKPDENPFVDPAGYKAYVALKEQAFRKTLADQQSGTGDFAGAAEQLRQRGATFTETDGIVTGVRIDDTSKFGDADFATLGKLTTLKTFSSSGDGLNDKTLASLAGLDALADFSSNAAQLSDDGLRGFTELPALLQIKFFHTSLKSKNFNGSGFAHLAPLKNLRKLTVAGCPFNDEGMAAVAKLTQLENFRTWHTYQTEAGNQYLKQLTNLKSLHLGQRLRRYGGESNAPSLTDATLDVLAELKSLDTLTLNEARLSLSALTKLQALPNLKRLELVKVDVSADDVAKLKQALPQVQIEWQPLTNEDRAKLEQYLKP